MRMHDFKYTSIFASTVKCIISEEKDMFLAKASLNELKKSVPNLPSDNQAFLPVAFNAFIANRINKNDDVIDTKTALAIYQKFINNPTNIEHKRHNVVGVIVSAGFSEFGTDKPLTYDDVKDLTIPFNVTLGAVVWKVINPEFANMLEESNDPTSDDFLSISASWELGFQEYKIIELNKSQKNIEGGRIISDASEVEKYSKMLRANGGTGVSDDKRLYRMPSDDVFPLGIGFTQKPAAEVKGVAVIQATTTQVNDSEAALTGTPTYDFYFCPKCDSKEQDVKSLQVNEFGHIACPSCKTTSAPAQWSKMPKEKTAKSSESAPTNKILDINEKNISQSSVSDVKIERKEYLMINSIKDLTDENLKVATASSIADLVSSEIKKGNDSWLNEKSALLNEKAEVQKQLTQASEEAAKNKDTLETLKLQVESLSKEKADREAVEQFNIRMGEATEVYEFDAEQSEVIASEIKSLKTAEEYTLWQAKAKKLFKPFQKKDKKDADKKDSGDDKGDDKGNDKKDAKASEAQASVDSAVDNGKKEGSVANSATANTPSLMEKYKEAFAMEHFVIKK
jgi:hypothetical protein